MLRKIKLLWTRFRDWMEKGLSNREWFDTLGGEVGVRAIINDFMDRVYRDMMIGFHFRAAPKAHIKEMEYQLAASWLGAEVSYQGRSLREAHRPHGIVGGHFMRRLKLLENTLIAHQVPDEIRLAWLAHNESLRFQVTGDEGSDCDHDVALARMNAAKTAKN